MDAKGEFLWGLIHSGTSLLNKGTIFACELSYLQTER